MIRKEEGIKKIDKKRERGRKGRVLKKERG